MKKILKIFLMIILYLVIIFIILIKTDSIHIEFINKTKEKTIDEYINNGLSIEDPNLNQSNGTKDTYYYEQLGQEAKVIYDKILEEEEKLKTGKAEIIFENNTFDYILEKEEGMDILSEEYQNAVDALRYDHVELFYIDFSKTVLRVITYTKGSEKTFEVSITKKDNEENYFLNSINDENTAKYMSLQVEEKAKEIIQEAQGTNYQKIQYIHNYLIDNITYDKTYNKENTRNIYGALIEKEVVCEGYSKSFKYLLDKMQIPCIIVAGQAINSEGKQERHSWNYVLINDVWYSVDCTWDDPIIINGNEVNNDIRYKYFCQGDNINKNHFAEEIITEGCQKWKYPELYHKDI